MVVPITILLERKSNYSEVGKPGRTGAGRLHNEGYPPAAMVTISRLAPSRTSVVA
jgi:hypothetical protein